MDMELLHAISEMMDQKLDEKIEPIYRRLDKIETRLDKVDTRLDKIEIRLDKLEESVEEIKESLTEVRESTNLLIGWAEEASVQLKIPLFSKAQ